MLCLPTSVHLIIFTSHKGSQNTHFMPHSSGFLVIPFSDPVLKCSDKSNLKEKRFIFGSELKVTVMDGEGSRQ